MVNAEFGGWDGGSGLAVAFHASQVVLQAPSHPSQLVFYPSQLVRVASTS